MSAEKHNIESLFQDALQHAELPVDPAVWQGVSAGISGAAAGAGAAGGLGLAAKVAVGVAVVAGVSAGAWFVTRPEAPVEQAAVPAITQEEHTEAPQPAQPAEVASTPEKTVDFHAAQQPEQQPEATPAAPDAPDAVEGQTTEALGESKTPPEVSVAAAQDALSAADPMHAPPPTPGPDMTDPVVAPDFNLSAVFDTVRMDPVVPQYVLQAQYSEAYAYTWLVDGKQVSTERQFAYLFEDAGLTDVTLIAADRSGATERYTLSVDVPEIPESSVTPANVFSPGNDAYNNTYDLEAMSEHCTLLRMQVFDASGTLVFETGADTRTWNGTDLYGNNCPSGRYLIKYWMRGDDGVMHDGRTDVTLFAP